MTIPMSDTPPPLVPWLARLQQLQNFINAVVSGSREHGAFGRGFTGEYVPHPLLTLDGLKAEVDALLIRQQAELKAAQKEAKVLRLERALKVASSRSGFDPQLDLAKQWVEEQQAILARAETAEAELTRLRARLDH